MKRQSIFPYPVAALLVLLAAGCASRDDSIAPDLESPVLTVYSPAPGDTVGIDSLSVIFQAVDDIGITKVDISLNDGPILVTITSAPWKASIPIASHPNGGHTVNFSAYDAAGNITNASVPFIKGLKSQEQVLRMVLGELVTSANCIPCAPANETYHQATDNDFYRARLATIKYHAWFPRSSDSLWRQSQAWARPRI